MVGTYLVPMLLSTFRVLTFEMGVFYIIWDFIFIVMTVRSIQWNILFTTAFLGVIGYAIVTVPISSHGDGITFEIIQTIQYILFVAGTVFYCERNKFSMKTGKVMAYLLWIGFAYFSICSVPHSIFAGKMWEPMIFFVILNALFIALAFRIKCWKILFGVACFAFLLFWTFSPLSLDKSTDFRQNVWYFLGFQVFQFIGIGIATSIFCHAYKFTLSLPKTWCYFPLIVIFYFVEFAHLEFLLPNGAPWIALLLAVCFIVLRMVDRYSWRIASRSGPVLRALMILIVLHAGCWKLASPSWRPIYGLGALVLLVIFALCKLDLKKKDCVSTILLGVTLTIGYYRTLIFNLDDQFAWRNLVFAGCYFAGIFGIYLGSSRVREKFENAWTYLLIAAHTQMIAGIYHLTLQMAGGMGIPDFDRFFLSMLWSIFALAVLSYGMKKKDCILANSCLFILAIPTLKVFFYDIVGTPRIVRILSFTILGVILFVGGMLFRKIQHWDKKQCVDHEEDASKSQSSSTQ